MFASYILSFSRHISFFGYRVKRFDAIFHFTGFVSEPNKIGQATVLARQILGSIPGWDKFKTELNYL